MSSNRQPQKNWTTGFMSSYTGSQSHGGSISMTYQQAAELARESNRDDPRMLYTPVFIKHNGALDIGRHSAPFNHNSPSYRYR